MFWRYASLRFRTAGKCLSLTSGCPTFARFFLHQFLVGLIISTYYKSLQHYRKPYLRSSCSHPMDLHDYSEFRVYCFIETNCKLSVLIKNVSPAFIFRHPTKFSNRHHQSPTAIDSRHRQPPVQVLEHAQNLAVSVCLLCCFAYQISITQTQIARSSSWTLIKCHFIAFKGTNNLLHLFETFMKMIWP